VRGLTSPIHPSSTGAGTGAPVLARAVRSAGSPSHNLPPRPDRRLGRRARPRPISTPHLTGDNGWGTDFFDAVTLRVRDDDGGQDGHTVTVHFPGTGKP